MIPKPIGPYAQSVKAGNLLFISGQIPMDPMTDRIVSGGIQEQTTQVLKNIAAILAAQGLSFENVAKAEIYLKDLAHFPEVNKLYGQLFPGTHKPARQVMQVAKLPMDVLIEISCIANF